MYQDTKDFLAALLWLASDNETDNGRALDEKTIHDFAPEFVERVEEFVNAFREEAERIAPACFSDGWIGERSFGGNVYLSLSGHGAGFFDDRDEEVSALHTALKKWAGAYRFEELDGTLEVREDGKIDISIIDSAKEEYYKKLFGVPKQKPQPSALPSYEQLVTALKDCVCSIRSPDGLVEWSVLNAEKLLTAISNFKKGN